MDAKDVGRLPHTLVDFILGKLPHLQPESQIFPDVHVRVEGVVLKDHRDVPILGRDVIDQACRR